MSSPNFVSAFLVGMQWYCFVVFIFISLKTKDVECVLICHLYIYFHEVSFHVFYPFSSWIVCCFTPEVWVFLTFFRYESLYGSGGSVSPKCPNDGRRMVHHHQVGVKVPIAPQQWGEAVRNRRVLIIAHPEWKFTLPTQNLLAMWEWGHSFSVDSSWHNVVIA